MKQSNVIDFAAYCQKPEPQSQETPRQLDELSLAILSLIERLRESKPLKQTG
jgi:hypothetical protein